MVLAPHMSRIRDSHRRLSAHNARPCLVSSFRKRISRGCEEPAESLALPLGETTFVLLTVGPTDVAWRVVGTGAGTFICVLHLGQPTTTPHLSSAVSRRLLHEGQVKRIMNWVPPRGLQQQAVACRCRWFACCPSSRKKSRWCSTLRPHGRNLFGQGLTSNHTGGSNYDLVPDILHFLKKPKAQAA